MCSTQIHDNCTLLPIALLCLFDEQLRMHEARQLVARVPRIVPLGMHVDGLFYTGPEEADQALQTLAKAEKYAHNSADVFQFKQAEWNDVPRCSQLSGQDRPCHRPNLRLDWEYDDTERSIEDGLAQYPLEEDEQKHRTRFNEILSASSVPLLSEVSFFIASFAIKNEGMLCLGAAGCGKSVLLKQIKTVLEGLGNKVRVCAYTHAACRMVGGETVAHLLHLNSSLSDTWFLVDEVGLLPISALGAMSRWTRIGAKFIFFGDYEGQFEPFVDRWNMSSNAGNNDLMRQLCRGYRVTLQTYRRGTDPQLFEWFHGMYGREDAHNLANASRARYPAHCDPRCDPLVLCLSHKKRMRVNARQNELLKPPNALFAEWEGEDLHGTTMQPQSFFVWVGLELIGCPRGSGKHLTVQGVVYVVTAIVDDVLLILQMRPEYCHGAADEQIGVYLEDACEQLRMCHAMCYYTVQGRTVRDRHIVLLDTAHPHFSVRALIVGLSRATHGRYLHVGDDEAETLFGDRKMRQKMG